MNAFTLACLIGTVASIRVLVDLSDEGAGGNSTNSTDTNQDEYVNPCPSACGVDPCAVLQSPCDDIQDDDAYEACWDTNPNANPWEACYAEGEGKTYWDC